MAKIPRFNPKLDSLTFDVEVRLSWRFNVRLWLGLRLIKWGTQILGAHCNITNTPTGRTPCDDCDIAARAKQAAELLRRTNDAMDAYNRGPPSVVSLGGQNAPVGQSASHWCGDPACSEVPNSHCTCGALLWFASEQRVGRCAKCQTNSNVEAQLDKDKLYYGESFHVERDGLKTHLPPDTVTVHPGGRTYTLHRKPFDPWDDRYHWFNGQQ